MSDRNSTKVERTCLTCNSKFFVKPHRIKEGRGIYCSKKCYGSKSKKSLEERFLEKVQKTDSCWIWLGAQTIGDMTYGVVHITRCKKERAHRFSWLLYRGEIPDGMCVLHNCPDGKDNPLCVNPDHLWLGTRRQNNDDRDAKGRTAKGDDHWRRRARLLREQDANQSLNASAIHCE